MKAHDIELAKELLASRDRLKARIKAEIGCVEIHASDGESWEINRHPHLAELVEMWRSQCKAELYKIEQQAEAIGLEF